jgi:hypothetical protein
LGSSEKRQEPEAPAFRFCGANDHAIDPAL